MQPLPSLCQTREQSQQAWIRCQGPPPQRLLLICWTSTTWQPCSAPATSGGLPLQTLRCGGPFWSGGLAPQLQRVTGAGEVGAGGEAAAVQDLRRRFAELARLERPAPQLDRIIHLDGTHLQVGTNTTACLPAAFLHGFY